MSIALLNLVWQIRHPGVRGNTRLVLLALADYADDEGGSIFPSQDTLAEKAGVSRRSAQMALYALQDLGCVEAVVNVGRSKHNEYRIMAQQLRSLVGETTQGVRNKGCQTAQPLRNNGQENAQNLQETAQNTTENAQNLQETAQPLRTEPSYNHQKNHQDTYNAGAREAEPQPPLAQARAVIGPLLANGKYPDFAAFWSALLAVYPTTGKKNLSAVKQWARQRIEPGEWCEIVECARDYAQSAVVVERGAVASLERFLTESNWLAYGAELPPVAKGGYTNGNGNGAVRAGAGYGNDRNSRTDRSLGWNARLNAYVQSSGGDSQEFPRGPRSSP